MAFSCQWDSTTRRYAPQTRGQQFPAWIYDLGNELASTASDHTHVYPPGSNFAPDVALVNFYPVKDEELGVVGLGGHQDLDDYCDMPVNQKTKERSEEYRQLFHLPPEESLIADFNCALQKKILLQDVACVRKARTASVFPNAIEIVSWGKKHFFASFMSRDEAFRLIMDGWVQHSSYAKLFLKKRMVSVSVGDNMTFFYRRVPPQSRRKSRIQIVVDESAARMATRLTTVRRRLS